MNIIKNKKRSLAREDAKKIINKIKSVSFPNSEHVYISDNKKNICSNEKN